MACSGVAEYCTGAAQLQQRSPLGEEAFKSMEGNFTWRLEASQRRVFVQEQQCECTGAAQLRFEVPMQKRLFPGDWRPVQSERFHDSSAQFHMRGFLKPLSIYGLCVATAW